MADCQRHEGQQGPLYRIPEADLSADRERQVDARLVRADRSEKRSLASSSRVVSRAGAVAGSVPRRADATGLTITSSTPNSSARARTWSAASVGDPTTARFRAPSATAWACG